jgi:hypothetical protein
VLKLARKLIDVSKLSPERIRIAKIFKKHIEQAILELGGGYIVDFQGSFNKTPIRIELEVRSRTGEIL